MNETSRQVIRTQQDYVRTYPSQVLRDRAVDVEEYDDSLRLLAHHMRHVMLREGGIGLAAPQVGDRRRVLVVRPDVLENGGNDVLVAINPAIIWRSEETSREVEFCLSLPGIGVRVARSVSVTVTLRDLVNDEHEMTLHGLAARVIQHEVDHLNGITLFNHADAVKKYQIRQRAKRWSRMGKSAAR